MARLSFVLTWWLSTCWARNTLTQKGRDASMSVTFVNPYDDEYELYWIDSTGTPNRLGTVAGQHGESAITTYVGHEFGWRRLKEETCSVEEIEGRVTIEAHMERYIFGEPVSKDPAVDMSPFTAIFTNKADRTVDLRRGNGELLGKLSRGDQTSAVVKAGDALDWMECVDDDDDEDESCELLYRTIVEYFQQTHHDFYDSGHTALCAERTAPATVLATVDYDDEGHGRKVDVLRNETDSFIAFVHDWSTTEECDQFSATASRRGLSEAQVFGTRTIIADRRAMAANLYWDDYNKSALTNTFIRRAFSLTRHFRGYDIHPGPYQEPLNFIQYGRAEEYRPHCDGVCYRKPYAPGGRVATLLHYCKAPELGGATVFPNLALKVQPRQNGALLFTYKGLDGFMDDGNTLHAGCLVKHGTKQVITMWMREDLSVEEPWSDFMS